MYRDDGKKLSPFLVFKGEKEKIKEKKLRAYSRSKGNKVYISCQEKAWANAEIFKMVKNYFFYNRVISNSIKKVITILILPNHLKKIIHDMC